MPLWKTLKQFRGKTSPLDFGKLIDCSAAYVRMFEQPDGPLPSNKIIRNISETFGKTPDEKARIEEHLVLERACDKTSRDLGIGVEFTQHSKMPLPFLMQLTKDLAGATLDVNFYKKTIEKKILESVLKGQYVLPREKIIALAMALNKPPARYVKLAGAVPDNLKPLFEHNGMSYMFRTLSGLSPSDMDEALDIINKMLTIYKEKKKK